MQTNSNSGKAPECYPFALVPECSYCGNTMRVTAAAVESHQQLVSYECFACLMIMHRHSRSADQQG